MLANRQITIDQYTGPANSIIESSAQRVRDEIAPELSRTLSESDPRIRRDRLSVVRQQALKLLRDVDALLASYAAD